MGVDRRVLFLDVLLWGFFLFDYWTSSGVVEVVTRCCKLPGVMMGGQYTLDVCNQSWYLIPFI